MKSKFRPSFNSFSTWSFHHTADQTLQWNAYFGRQMGKNPGMEMDLCVSRPPKTFLIDPSYTLPPFFHGQHWNLSGAKSLSLVGSDYENKSRVYRKLVRLDWCQSWMATFRLFIAGTWKRLYSFCFCFLAFLLPPMTTNVLLLRDSRCRGPENSKRCGFIRRALIIRRVMARL